MCIYICMCACELCALMFKHICIWIHGNGACLYHMICQPCGPAGPWGASVDPQVKAYTTELREEQEQDCDFRLEIHLPPTV